MGFKPNAWATVWGVDREQKGNFTKVRLSTSRKNKDGNYEQDFSGFCTFIGQAHTDAASLSERDRIRIGECEVLTHFDKAKNKEYINYNVYTFEPAVGNSNSSNSQKPQKKTAFDEIVEEGEANDEAFPF